MDFVMICFRGYVAALSYYNSMKMAARMNIPEAKTILADLSQRFSNEGNYAEEDNEA